MLSRPHVIRALQAKRAAFVNYDVERIEMRDRYGQYLASLAGRSAADIVEHLKEIARPGGLPTAERIQGASIVRTFAPRWQHHQEARAWALERLQNVPTFAIDGSQITPDPSLALPVGAVQIGWFENPHSGEERYIKDILFEVLPPDELMPDQMERQTFPDQLVNARRFELECRQLAAYMRAHAQDSVKPICFFDGSLVISFAAQMRVEMQRRYIACIQDLLAASEDSRVPLVGYIDTSYATDLISMLQHLQDDHLRPQRLSDGGLLRPLMAWGDRTEAFQCARDDRLFEQLPDLDYYGRVVFAYLKTTSTNAPARLDLPAWLLEDGILEDVVDIVRAECIVGVGYPYAIETADAVAVISMQDREHFYRVLQEFAQENRLSWSYSRKALSKRGRR
jgi:hypothetical protein